MAERTRIAREMHDVLAHRISLLALHAGGLEVRPDLPPAKVRETAELMRLTARQALEELRGVIGVLREEAGHDPQPPAAPLPTLSDIRRLVEETRLAGARIDFEMQVDQADAVPSALGRDAYRIVQEALTNTGKHARGSTAWVRITGGPDDGLHVSVRNRKPLRASPGPALPGSGAGLLGLQERVALAGGTLVHGPDASGDFVVDAELQWHDKGAAGRRRRARSPRSPADPFLRRGPCGRRRGRRRRTCSRSREGAPTRRRADGHQDGGDGRHHRHRCLAPARLTTTGDRADHLPGRRAGDERPPCRGQRFPGQGHPARRHHQRRSTRRIGRGHRLAFRHPHASLPLRERPGLRTPPRSRRTARCAHRPRTGGRRRNRVRLYQCGGGHRSCS